MSLESYSTEIAHSLGAYDSAAQQDITHFMTRAAQDMHLIMSSYANDAELVHSSAMIAAAHAYNAGDYKTTINEKIEAALNAAGEQAHKVREKIYQAIEGEYTKNA